MNTIFRELKSNNTTIKNKFQLVNSLMKIMIQRMKDGAYNQKHQLFLKTIYFAIVDCLNKPDINESELAEYLERFEKEFKKFYYVFYVNGKDNWTYSSIRQFLTLNEYNVIDENDPLYDSELCIKLNCSGEEDMNTGDSVDIYKYMSACYFNNNSYQHNMANYYGNLKAGYEVVITGLSYIYYGIKPELFHKNTAMLATPSQDLFYDFQMLKKAYSESGGTLKYAIAGLSPYSLRYDLSLSSLKNRALIYYPELKDLHHFEDEDLKSFVKNENIKISDYFGYDITRDIYYELFYPQLRISDQNKYHCSVFDENNISDSEFSDMYGKFHKDYPLTIAENKQILMDYMQFCQDRNIKLIFLMPPFSGWYKEHWDNSYLMELWDFINSLSDQFNFSIFDFTDEDWDNSYFSDYAHLNDIGAIKFTNILNQLLEQMYCAL